MTTTRRPSTGQHAARFLAGFLVLFVAGDLIIARLRLPYILGSTNAVRKKWESLHLRYKTPDVVILGSSYEEFGVNPLVLDEWVAKHLGRPTVSVNYSSFASSLATEYLVVREMLGTGPSPKLAYLGITPYAVDVRKRDWIVNGLRAFGDSRDLAVSWSVDDATFYEALTATLFRSYRQWNDLRLIWERVVLAAPTLASDAARLESRGWYAWRGRGGLPHMRLTKSEKLHSSDTDPFQRDNVNGLRVREMIRMLRDRGVEVRLLELPHASTSLPESNPSKNKRYRRFVNLLIADTGVPLVRPPTWLLCDQDYFDNGHLRPTGAAKLSRWLAHDVSKALSCRESDHDKTVTSRF